MAIQIREPQKIEPVKMRPRRQPRIEISDVCDIGMRLAWGVVWIWIIVSLFSGSCRYTVTHTSISSSYGFSCQR